MHFYRQQVWMKTCLVVVKTSPDYYSSEWLQKEHLECVRMPQRIAAAFLSWWHRLMTFYLKKNKLLSSWIIKWGMSGYAPYWRVTKTSPPLGIKPTPIDLQAQVCNHSASLQPCRNSSEGQWCHKQTENRDDVILGEIPCLDDWQASLPSFSNYRD